MLVKFEQNRMAQTLQNLELFDQKKRKKKKKKVVFKTIFDKALTPFWKIFLAAETIFLMLNY